MTDHYYIVERVDGVETWRSQPFVEERRAVLMMKLKEKSNPAAKYNLELRQPEKAYKY